MSKHERKIIYEATKILVNIPPARGDRVRGAVKYSREIRQAIMIFESIVVAMINDDAYMLDYSMRHLMEFANQIDQEQGDER